MNNKLIWTFLAGAAAGAIAGVLFAPDKGSSTRKKIAGKATDIRDAARDSFHNLIDGVKKAYHQVRDEAEELSDAAVAKMSAAKKQAEKALS